MTAIQKSIKTCIESITEDISSSLDAEENLKRAQAIKALVEAYSIYNKAKWLVKS